MRVAVLTLTRDRIDYTRHCFASLRENAGVVYDHFVLDQGSEDGTADWLRLQPLKELLPLRQNIGCCRGWNLLLDVSCSPADYDVVVCFDNDCELVDPDTLKDICEAAVTSGAILSPRIMGLRNPPPIISTFSAGEQTVDETTILGNIFMAIPAPLLEDFRWDESYPVWAGGESITGWHRARGGRCGYVQGYEAWHYRTTDGQHQDYPSYFDRRVLEGGPV